MDERARAVTVGTLEEHEAYIEAALEGAWLRVAEHLKAIHGAGLYKERYGTWERYCRERWGRQRQWGYQLLEAANVVENVRHGVHGLPLPANERQVRPLVALPPDEQAAAWQEAITRHGTPTVRQIGEVVAERTAAGKRSKAALPDWRTLPVVEAQARLGKTAAEITRYLRGIGYDVVAGDVRRAWDQENWRPRYRDTDGNLIDHEEPPDHMDDEHWALFNRSVNEPMEEPMERPRAERSAHRSPAYRRSGADAWYDAFSAMNLIVTKIAKRGGAPARLARNLEPEERARLARIVERMGPILEEWRAALNEADH